MSLALHPSGRSPPSDQPDSRIARTCLAVFTIVWAALAIAPEYPDAWLLENLLIFAAVPTLVVTRTHFRFSDRAYVQMTIFLLLHAVGSHYTYSEVPIGMWARDSLDLSRNHYDRLVHFSFGLLFMRPLLELSVGSARGLGRVAIAWIGVAGIAALSTGYELLEWVTAIVVDPGAGTAFLGTQGDVWDAQKDTALACAGAFVALFLEPGLLLPSARGRVASRSQPR